MRRLLNSSKFQAGAAAILAAVLIAFGVMSEENAEEFAALLIKLIGGLAGAYVVAVGVEDAASKRAGKDVGPPKSPMILLFLLSGMLLAGGPGCSLFYPGHDVRQAAESRSFTAYSTDELQIEESTTHNRRTVMAEGENLTAEYYEDGSPKKISEATHVLSQWSEPKDATDAYMQLASLNAQLGMQVLSLSDRIAGLVSARSGITISADGAIVPPSPAETDRTRRLDRLIDLLEGELERRHESEPSD